MDTQSKLHQDFLTLPQKIDMRIALTKSLLDDPEFSFDVMEVYATRLKFGSFDPNAAKDLVISLCEAIDKICETNQA